MHKKEVEKLICEALRLNSETALVEFKNGRGGLPNGAYIRDGNTDRRMTEREMRKLIEEAKKYKFDIKRAPGAKLTDISKDK